MFSHTFNIEKKTDKKRVEKILLKNQFYFRRP